MHQPIQVTMCLEQRTLKDHSQFSEHVVQKHTHAYTKAPFQNRKNAIFYATQTPADYVGSTPIEPRYSSPQQLPVFEPLNEQQKKMKKDKLSINKNFSAKNMLKCPGMAAKQLQMKKLFE